MKTTREEGWKTYQSITLSERVTLRERFGTATVLGVIRDITFLPRVAQIDCQAGVYWVKIGKIYQEYVLYQWLMTFRMLPLACYGEATRLGTHFFCRLQLSMEHHDRISISPLFLIVSPVSVWAKIKARSSHVQQKLAMTRIYINVLIVTSPAFYLWAIQLSTVNDHYAYGLVF